MISEINMVAMFLSVLIPSLLLLWGVVVTAAFSDLYVPWSRKQWFFVCFLGGPACWIIFPILVVADKCKKLLDKIFWELK